MRKEERETKKKTIGESERERERVHTVCDEKGKRMTEKINDKT